MSRGLPRFVCGLLPIFAASGCSSSPQPLAPTTTVPAIVLVAPIPVAPANGATTSGWPALTVNDAARVGAAAALVYRFDVATSAAFNPILATGTVSETAGTTSFTPPSNTPATPPMTLFWRAIAIDPINVVASPSSVIQSFTYTNPPSAATLLAAQEGLTLWPGAQPPGKSGQAMFGGSWNVQNTVSFHGVPHVTPTIDELRVFDLLDRAFSPQAAINWINGNGYFTDASWYPDKQVIGFDFEYMALNSSGQWDLIFRME